MEVSSGSVIAGRFEVVKRIGAGGMGMVFTAIDRELNDNVVALKLLLPHLASDEQVFKRFLNEVLVARSLSHPNVCRIHDIGKAESGYYYISMEYVDGVSLKERICPDEDTSATRGNYKPLTFEDSLQIFADITSGVAYAHSREVIHRDLKPGNVLISKRGEVKLADFGTARIIGRDTSLTQTGQVIGTPDYMSPEQIRGEALDSACDIYSLGIIGYELVTGERPYVADSAVAVAFKHLSEPLPPFPERLKHVPAWYRDLIVKATSKAHADRFKNGLELMAELQKYVRTDIQGTKFFTATGGLQAEPTGRFEMGENSSAAPGKDWQFGTTGTETGMPPQLNLKKKSGGWLIPVLLILVVLGGGAGFFAFRDNLLPAALTGTKAQPELSKDEIAAQLIKADRVPTVIPTVAPTEVATIVATPTAIPTVLPTATPTAAPTPVATQQPTPVPTKVHLSAQLKLKVRGSESSEINGEDVRQAFWSVEIKGLNLEEVDKLSINLVSSDRGSLIARLHPTQTGMRSDGVFLEGKFEGPARSLSAGDYRLDVTNNHEMLASRRFSVESAVAATPVATLQATSAPIADVPTAAPTEAPLPVSKSFSGTIDLPSDDGLTTRTMKLSLTFTGPDISGTAAIQGLGDLVASGKELVRGYEVTLRGDTISLRLTSGKGDASLRGSYIVAGKPVHGTWAVQRIN